MKIYKKTPPFVRVKCKVNWDYGRWNLGLGSIFFFTLVAKLPIFIFMRVNLIKGICAVTIACLSFSSYAQERYLEVITDSVEVQTFTYVTKNGENLNIDVYLPWLDDESERPLILFVHGGGFSGGRRDDPGSVQFCRNLASHGYVSASLSYRLTRKDQSGLFGCDCPAIEKLNTFQAAVEDVQDATFFLIENRESLGINPQKIILAGSSAGAEAILNAGFSPPNCFGLDSGPVSYAGMISMAGAIPDLEKVYEESAIPTLFFHGTCDNLVPYATASHHYCDSTQPGHLILYGSYPISRKLEQLGVPYWLHSTCGGRHELAGTPMTKYFDVILEFAYRFVLNSEQTKIHTIVSGNADICDYESFDFCNQ